ncbi:MAG TPA: lysozyme [Xylella sp.]
MKLGTEGLSLIKYFEGCKLTSYECPGGKWTIGYGDTGPTVVPGMKITQEEAETRLHHRMSREFEPGVRAAVRVRITQHQFDALVSLAYNIGLDHFRRSTLLRKLNAGDVEGAAAQFKVWKYAAGRVSAGLITRRAAERVLFEGGDWQAEAERLRAEARRKPRA